MPLFKPSGATSTLILGQTAPVQDLPTGVGRSLRPDGSPKKFIMAAQRSYAKVSKVRIILAIIAIYLIARS